jgi:hypothetical protein
MRVCGWVKAVISRAKQPCKIKIAFKAVLQVGLNPNGRETLNTPEGSMPTACRESTTSNTLCQLNSKCVY